MADVQVLNSSGIVLERVKWTVVNNSKSTQECAYRARLNAAFRRAFHSPFFSLSHMIRRDSLGTPRERDPYSSGLGVDCIETSVGLGD